LKHNSYKWLHEYIYPVCWSCSTRTRQVTNSTLTRIHVGSLTYYGSVIHRQFQYISVLLLYTREQAKEQCNGKLLTMSGSVIHRQFQHISVLLLYNYLKLSSAKHLDEEFHKKSETSTNRSLRVHILKLLQGNQIVQVA